MYKSFSLKSLLFSSVLTQLLLTSPLQASTFTFSTADSVFSGGSLNQGFYSRGSTRDPLNSRLTVGFGDFLPDLNESRNFVTFDLSSLSEVAISATLRITYNGGSLGDFSYNLFDISTSAAELNLGTGNTGLVFADIGSGISYGSFSVNTRQLTTNTVLEFTLNAQGVAAINNSKGDFFSIGGATVYPIGGYIFTGSPVASTLVIETVPEPGIASPFLLIIGASLIGCKWRYMKRHEPNSQPSQSSAIKSN